MIQVRKILNGTDQGVQGASTSESGNTTNAQVAALFENKPDLTAVTLEIGGNTKRYERVVEEAVPA